MNKYEKMNIRDYADEDALIDEILNFASIFHDKSWVIELYAKSELINYVFTQLLMKHDYNCGYINFSRGFYDSDYECEYCLGITDDGNVCVEPAFISYDGGKMHPFNSDATIAFAYQEDCCQEVIDSLLDHVPSVFLFGIGEDDTKNDDCKNHYDCTDCPENSDTDTIHTANIIQDEDAPVHGFSQSWSDGCYYRRSFYTTESLTAKEIQSLIDKWKI
jgi:hypothetical protein